MTPNLTIAQAVFDSSNLRTKSRNFVDDWLPLAQRLITGFGKPVPEVEFAEALFAQPFGRAHVAIVQVARPAAVSEMRFRFLILEANLYSYLHDPFAIAGRFPPFWEATGGLAELDWPREVPAPRTIGVLDAILKNGDGPLLLGGAQTLVDGAKILLQRSGPETKLVRDLWTLLPDSVRRNAWPSTFAFSSELGFDVLVMPVLPEKWIPGYLSEDQTRDYPESRYERNLQAAIESGDAGAVERLLARETTSDMIRFALRLLAAMMVFAVIAKLLFH